jgi:hypothetical protein
MPNRNKIEWLRAAAKEGFHDIERGDYVTLRSGKEIDDFIDQLGEEAFAEFAARQNSCGGQPIVAAGRLSSRPGRAESASWTSR